MEQGMENADSEGFASREQLEGLLEGEGGFTCEGAGVQQAPRCG